MSNEKGTEATKSTLSKDECLGAKKTTPCKGSVLEETRATPSKDIIPKAKKMMQMKIQC